MALKVGRDTVQFLGPSFLNQAMLASYSQLEAHLFSFPLGCVPVLLKLLKLF